MGQLGSYFTRVVGQLSAVGNNLAVAGQTTPQMLTDVRSQILPLYDSSHKDCIVLIQEGTNDMHLNGKLASDAFNVLAEYSKLLQQGGFKTVWIAATPRNSPPAPFASVPATYDWKGLNTLIRDAIATPQGSSAAGIDAFADIAAIPQIGGDNAQNNPTYYNDGIHFYTEASYQLITPVVVQAIQSIPNLN